MTTKKQISSTTINKKKSTDAIVYGPTDRAIEIYKYPENLIKEYVDYLQIETYKYTSLTEYYDYAGVRITTNSTGAAVSRASGSSATPISASTNTLEGYSGKGIAQERFLRGRTINKFQLPIPDAIQIDDAPMWNLEDLRTLGKFLPTFGKQFASGDLTNAADTLKNLADGAKPEIILGLAEQSQFFSSKEAITQGFNGKILNPYYEMIFKGLQPRTFSCRYKLVPRNLKEQTQIKNIIKYLRVNSLPNYSQQSNTDDAGQNTFSGLGDRWLTTPNIFNLKFLSAGVTMSYLPRFKPMVCTSVSTNYTPDGGWFTHADAAPNAIELLLRFNEVEIITAKEVEDGNY